MQRGFSGYNTRWNKLILPRIVDAEMAKDLAAVVILLGANDSNRGDLNPTQHIPLEEYKLNLVHMVEYLMVSLSKETKYRQKSLIRTSLLRIPQYPNLGVQAVVPAIQLRPVYPENSKSGP